MDVVLLAILGLTLDAKVFGEELLPQFVNLILELFFGQTSTFEVMLEIRAFGLWIHG